MTGGGSLGGQGWGVRVSELQNALFLLPSFENEVELDRRLTHHRLTCVTRYPLPGVTHYPPPLNVRDPHPLRGVTRYPPPINVSGWGYTNGNSIDNDVITGFQSRD
jgi:hypothetical protein